MKRALLILALILLVSTACAEPLEKYLDSTEINDLQSFAADTGSEIDVRALASEAAEGNFASLKGLTDMLLTKAREAAVKAASACGALFAPAMMLALVRKAAPLNGDGSRGAGFVIRLTLIAGLLESGVYVIDSAETCIGRAAAFSDAAAPVFTVLTAALGRTDAAALISPAAGLVGDICIGLFQKFGLPLCGFALCAAAASGFGESARLDRTVGMMEKIVCWGSGLCTAVFTALTAARSGLSSAIDGIAARTAKYAVDSAAPVIGSGVSDAWEAYVSGVLIAKNALGVSGMLLLAAACALPAAEILAAYLIQSACAAFAEMLGDRRTAEIVGSMGSVCKMSLTMCTCSIAVSTILLGAAMRAAAP